MQGHSLATAAFALLSRDLRLAFRRRGEALSPILFLLMVATLFPLGLSPDPEQLAAIAPGVIWVAALLSSLLALNQMFHADLRDGTLEQLIISPWPLPVMALVKVLAHWIISGLPLTVVAPVLGLGYGLDGATVKIMFWSLLLGTPTLSFIGAIGVALSVGLHRGGMFLALLVLPLFVPVLIFATAGISASAEGFAVGSHLYLLGALLALAVSTAPFAIAAGLRISIS
ncbi:MAG: heme exporter protein CcmB [Xanthomonadales bacterium]|nr:heme exporter protein CcmB [Xanthomonadales bacterium]